MQIKDQSDYPNVHCAYCGHHKVMHFWGQECVECSGRVQYDHDEDSVCMEFVDDHTD